MHFGSNSLFHVCSYRVIRAAEASNWRCTRRRGRAGKKLSDCSDTRKTITTKRKNYQLFTLFKNSLKKEIKLTIQSHIYQDQMEQRLEDVCVWSDDMPDVMLVRTHEFKLQIRARITRAWLVKNQENNQTFGLLAHMTEKLPALVQHWHWWGCLRVDACSLPRILQAAWWLTEIN